MRSLAEQVALRSLPPRGTTTGLPGLDLVTGGLRPSQVWLIVGAPGVGRTTLLTQLALAVARRRVRCLLDCHRESDVGIRGRLVAQLGRPDVHDPRREQLVLGPEQSAALHAEVSLPLLVSTSSEGQSWRTESPQDHLEALFVDDFDLAPGWRPDDLGRLGAQFGSVVATAVTGYAFDRDGCLRQDLHGRVDVVIEIADHTMSRERPGEADLVVRLNRHGPKATIPVVHQLHRARFQVIAP